MKTKKRFSHTILFPALAALVLLFQSCTKDEVETTGTIYGIVNNADSSEPIQGASVSLNPGGKSTTTGSDGRYEFNNMDPGQYTIQIQKPGFQTNTKRINVVAGEVASGDLLLSRGDAKIKLSATSLNFGKENNSLTFNIINVGTSGAINWTITGAEEWFSVSPTSGTTNKDKASAIVVTLSRDKLKVDASANLIVQSDGESLAIAIHAEAGLGGGGSGSNENVTSCDSRIPIEVLSCQRNGTSLTMTYKLTNTGMGKDLSAFYIHPNNASNRNSFSDNQGKVYTMGNTANSSAVTLEVAGKSSYNEVISFALPLSAPVQGSITIKDFAAQATSLNARIYCAPLAGLTLASDWITFKDIQIK